MIINMLIWIMALGFFLVPILLILEVAKFCLPIRWRLNPAWDLFLCRVGSHRCYSPCGLGCCWACIPCERAEHGYPRPGPRLTLEEMKMATKRPQYV